jgi:hypothetical protein
MDTWMGHVRRGGEVGVPIIFLGYSNIFIV